jgi:hypothetical protein
MFMRPYLWGVVLFLAQVSLAATGHVSWHVKLGRIGIGYGLLVIVAGLVTGIIRSADRVVAGGNAAQLLYVAFLDIALFSVFFGAAIVFRRKPQLHKRLMVVAATILVVASVFRLSFLPAAPLRVHVRLILWSVPILLAIVHDLRSRQPIHQVYVFGLVALLIRNYSVSLHRRLNVFPIVLVLMVLYQVLAFVVPELPQWQSFARWFAE